MKYKNTLLFLIVGVCILILSYVASLQRVTIDDVWFINLDRDVERREHYRKLEPLFGVPVRRWPATNGRDMTREEASRKYGITTAITRSNDAEENKKNPNILHQPGVYGCWISHKRLLTHLNTLPLSNSHGHLITEDDIAVPADFQSQWDTIRRSIPYNWDIVYLYIGKPHGDRIAPRVMRWRNDADSGNNGTVAYIVRHGALPKILKELRYMDSPIDVQFYRHFGSLNIYMVDPVLISTGEFDSSIININNNVR